MLGLISCWLETSSPEGLVWPAVAWLPSGLVWPAVARLPADLAWPVAAWLLECTRMSFTHLYIFAVEHCFCLGYDGLGYLTNFSAGARDKA